MPPRPLPGYPAGHARHRLPPFSLAAGAAWRYKPAAMDPDQQPINTALKKALVAISQRVIENDERMIDLMKLLHRQLGLVAGRLEIDGFPALQAGFRALLAQVETEHETRLAELRSLKDILGMQ